MTNTSKSTTLKKKKSIASSNQPPIVAETPSDTGFSPDRWLLIFPVGAMVVICLYIFIMSADYLLHIAPPFLDAFLIPPFPALLIALLGLGYIYNTLKGRPIRKLSRIIVRILLIVFLAFLPFAATSAWGGNGPDANPFLAYALFGNPFTLAILSILAIAGGVGLMGKLKK
ncbi:hypothetical protein OG194_20900 [Streptomyces sp. NBC_01288]|uniref:hypothetical protein n=1 Tax=Streptomyces sp. NBC_01288 TaxID=2903814 RepID=UPI002E15560C|nr:hypothetical protein OG194_20900 [Streptomyces sp. NBC_01288]